MASPKLRQFLAKHPEASKSLTNSLYQAFGHKVVQLYYFYSDNDAVPRASHYYPTESAVGIIIRENQQPSDEFICLLFELLNSGGEKQFKELFRKAESGEISRTNFAQEMLKVEFTAAKTTRDLLRTLKFGKKEIAESYYYNRFIDCPDEFNNFVDYCRRVSSPNRDPIKDFEEKYDGLRKDPSKGHLETHG